MAGLNHIESKLFNLKAVEDFNAFCLEIFSVQYERNKAYRDFVDLLKINPAKVKELWDIPFLPIELFKSHNILLNGAEPALIFTSSGTTGADVSKHAVSSEALYQKSFTHGFERIYGSPEEYRILALLPGYLERSGSSLIYMVQKLIDASRHSQSGFFLNNTAALRSLLKEDCDRKTLLIGVSHALLDFIEAEPIKVHNTIVMETGGMKGRRVEITRSELHGILKSGFGVSEIHSEYGMTELLSQAYATADGLFETPPWMEILIRDANDPLSPAQDGRTGGLNIIDLANLYSCSFIATSDLGRKTRGKTEILGRMDYSDMRGCNLMVMQG